MTIHRYEGGLARMTEDSLIPGSLAGSGLTLDIGVRNAISMLGLDLPMATRMVSTNPARVLRLSERKGRIEPGYDADLVLLDDQRKVRQTWVGGISRYPA